MLLLPTDIDQRRRERLPQLCWINRSLRRPKSLMSAAEKLRIIQDEAYFSVEEELMAHVKPGIYTLGYVKHETRSFFGSSVKAVFWFRVVDQGEHFGKLLPRYYNVKLPSNRKVKLGRNGKFVPGRNSDFLREFCRLFPSKFKRRDQIPLSAFKSVLIKGKVRTTSKDYKQRTIAEPIRYSVIAELLEVEE